MSNSEQEAGIGILALLTIVLVALKLTGYLSWSWWWVIAPLWVTPLLVIVSTAIILVVLVFGILTEHLIDRAFAFRRRARQEK